MRLSVTKDNDKDVKGKLIIFPENRIKKKITKPQESPFAKRLKEQQTREFIEHSVDEIGFDLLRSIFCTEHIESILSL